MSDASNPYQPTTVETPPKPGSSAGTMEYMRSFHYIFENPNWIKNVLAGAVCILSMNIIPFVGQLLFMGYQYEIVENLHRNPGASYVDFDMNRFVEYLLRGLWILLVTLVLSLACLPVILGLIILLVALATGGGAAAGDDGVAIAVMVGMPILVLVCVPLGIAFNMLCVPIILRAALMQDFLPAFDFGFAKQFIGNTWKEMILCALFGMAAGMVLMAVGMAMLCVGTFFTMAIATLMQGHLIFQLYELHLARGGDAIPLKAVAA